MKKVLVIFLVAVLLIPAFANGQKEDATVTRVAMVTDVGGVSDQSFNQSAWEGLQRAEEDFGVSVSYAESNQDADYSPNIDMLIDGGNSLIWGIGFLMGDIIEETARINPNTKFAIIDYAYGEYPDNLVGVVFKAEQPSFLVGYIAGKMTKTNRVGFIGGMRIPVIGPFEWGFKAGVKLANPNAVIVDQYAESFTDAARGKAIATQMYQQGADVIFHAAGAVGDGVIEAAREQNKWVIGVDRDQNYLAPKNVLTSAMKRVDNAVYNVVRDLVEGTYTPGTTVYGLAEGGVGLAPTSDVNVPANILAEARALEQRIIAGEIVVPQTQDEYNAFINN